MGIETKSPASRESIHSGIDAADLRHNPRSASGSVLEDTLATENTQVVHGWLVDRESADHHSRAGDLS